MGRSGKKSATPKASKPTVSEQKPEQLPEPASEPLQRQDSQRSQQHAFRVTCEADAKPGDVVFSEAPILNVSQKKASYMLEDLQRWLIKFGLLDVDSRITVLAMPYHKKAASGGILAGLVGKRGEHVEERLRLTNGVSSDEAWALLRIVERNAIEVQTAENQWDSMLLPSIPGIKHSCLPNAALGLGNQPGIVDLRALKALAAGESVTISYFDEEHLLSSTSERRKQLEARRQFECDCTRCVGIDVLRAFRCPKQTCRGVLNAVGAGDGLSSCRVCQKVPTDHATSEILAAERRLLEIAPEARIGLQKVAGSLSIAVQKRDAAGFSSAMEVAMHALGKGATAASDNKQVDASHIAVVGLAKDAAKVRTLLGDSLAATGRGELAAKMWRAAARELREGIDNENRAFPLPRHGRLLDLVGLAGVHGRTGCEAEARACFAEAFAEIDLVSWSAPQERREELQIMRENIETMLAAAN